MGDVFGSEDNKVYALKADTGEYIWSYATEAEIMIASVKLDGV